MIIRPYKEKDAADVRFVCLNCDGPSQMSPEGEHFILVTYCDYFIEKEPQNCFVACDDNDKAIGYIISAESYDRYAEVFTNEYIPRIPENQTSHRAWAATSARLQGKYKDDFPAHMHIDILPEYQRMGLGKMLTDALCGHLRSKGIKGLILSVSPDNTKGVSFYEKYGFTLLEETPDGNAYGIKLL